MLYSFFNLQSNIKSQWSIYLFLGKTFGDKLYFYEWIFFDKNKECMYSYMSSNLSQTKYFDNNLKPTNIN